MKFKNLFLFAAIAIVASCGKYEFDATQVNQEIATQQAKNQLGIDIDPNQDWMPVRNGSVTIIANADLENIARVEVLTESPFGNEDAMVLNSVECKAGQQVTLDYEAPNYLTQLVAACVNDQGVYFIKVFDIDTKVVDFQATSNGVRTRADAVGGFPATIVLGTGEKSFNALRAEESQNNQYGIKIDKYWYTVWKDNSWANDMLWKHAKVEGEGGWYISKDCIRRDVTDVVDIPTIETAITTYLKKFVEGDSDGKVRSNNWYNAIINNSYFKQFNELESDGNPLLLVPVRMYSTDGESNSIYYYYYNPATAPTDNIALANYIKTLPKYKALWCFWNDDAKTFKREREYLLPYYGDGTPIANTWGSPVIPKGYKIGFMNRKNKGSIYKNNSGCTYGFGELNVEVNHLVDHFFSVIDKSISQEVYTSENGDKVTKQGLTANGMDWNSPRICMRDINNRTYLCFEDGSDLNFSDMIIEVKTGTKIQLAEVKLDVEPAIYTMCFEDRPAQADYDMNDVVLTAEPVNGKKQVKLRLIACGAKDKVYLKIDGSSKFNNQEVHALLDLTEEESFLNTQVGGKTKKEKDCPVETINLNGKTIMEFLKSIKIQNAATGQTIGMPGQGEAPYVIIVPMRFNYPKEGSDIRKSYPEFLEWANNATTSKNWYRSLEGVDRFPTLILK